MAHFLGQEAPHHFLNIKAIRLIAFPRELSGEGVRGASRLPVDSGGACRLAHTLSTPESLAFSLPLLVTREARHGSTACACLLLRVLSAKWPPCSSTFGCSFHRWF